MIFNQFMDEDEGERLAQKLQNEMYGGMDSNNQPNQAMMDQNQPEVRQADSNRYEQMIGGSDDFGGMDHGVNVGMQNYHEENIPDE